MPYFPEIDRRSFLQTLAAAGVTLPIVGCQTPPVATPSGKLRFASVGAGGMAGVDIDNIASSPKAELIAVADVDLSRTQKIQENYPNARIYQDWREMFAAEADNIDAVCVSTPDHMHAAVAMSAMELGKHVYCQKPLAHDLHDVRRLTQYARRRGVVTQMGIQIHSERFYLEAVEVVRSGKIGKVKAAHLWSDKKWGDTGAPPEGDHEIPENFDWDGWLGVTADRKFVGEQYYHPGNWRRRLDFGTGTFGDMGCHIFDPVFDALGLTAPIAVRSEGPAPDAWNWANNARIRYTYPPTPYTVDEPIEFVWYDGDQRPPQEILDLITETVPEPDMRPPPKRPDQGSIIIGTEGVMLLPHFRPLTLFPRAKFRDWERPDLKTQHHWHQWVDACLGEGETSTPFSYAGPLTEAVLLGCIAVRFPDQTLEWNAPNMTFTNKPTANNYLRSEPREGWEVRGLA